MRDEARFGLLAGFAYLAFFPFFYWVGFRQLWLYGGMAAAFAVIAYAELVVVKRDPTASGRIALAGHLVLLALLVVATSPYLIGPGPGCIIVMLLATQPAIAPTWVVAVASAIVTLAPVLLGQLGVLPTMLSTDGANITVNLMAERLNQTASAVTLVVYSAALILMSMVIGRMQDDEHRRARRTIEIQSWQLRQLL